MAAQVQASAPTAPPTGTVPAPTRVEGATFALLRLFVGALWLTGANWKIPPDFGRDTDGGLWHFTTFAVDNPVLPPYSWLVEEVVLEHFVVFGWFVLVSEALLGALLLAGLVTRAAALAGAVLSLTILLTVALTPPEWPWSYYLMIAVHLAVFATAAGRTWGLDGILRPIVADRPGASARWYRRCS
ncbi:MAG: hypothetical protein MUF83_10170 [Acidimicrobiales bacterium]|jgi:thiosulfate dehydrogenase [quinone] large subunit|nr:hypothetical protein [Acidimicrobiales bacterium]